jgi:hypothetical protein
LYELPAEIHRAADKPSIGDDKEMVAARGCPLGTLSVELVDHGDGLERQAEKLFGPLIEWSEAQFRELGARDPRDHALTLIHRPGRSAPLEHLQRCRDPGLAGPPPRGLARFARQCSLGNPGLAKGVGFEPTRTPGPQVVFRDRAVAREWPANRHLCFLGGPRRGPKLTASREPSTPGYRDSDPHLKRRRRFWFLSFLPAPPPAGVPKHRPVPTRLTPACPAPAVIPVRFARLAPSPSSRSTPTG